MRLADAMMTVVKKIILCLIKNADCVLMTVDKQSSDSYWFWAQSSFYKIVMFYLFVPKNHVLQTLF